MSVQEKDKNFELPSLTLLNHVIVNMTMTEKLSRSIQKKKEKKVM